MQWPRECVLYTLEGPKEALVYAPEWTNRTYRTCYVRAIDSGCAIRVSEAMASSKLEHDPKPTFYAC